LLDNQRADMRAMVERMPDDDVSGLGKPRQPINRTGALQLLQEGAVDESILRE
jgi:hypothetical protein